MTQDEVQGRHRRLVVGLGNPGRKYAGTRHNIGFDVVVQLAKNFEAGAVKNKFKGETTEVRIGQKQVCLLCPSTYMNVSGSSVKPAVDFFKLRPEEVLVVCDLIDQGLGDTGLADPWLTAQHEHLSLARSGTAPSLE